jgi:hypothetical protein
MMTWAQLKTKSKYIGSGDLSNTQCLGLSSWLNLIILDLLTFQTYDVLGLVHN